MSCRGTEFGNARVIILEIKIHKKVFIREYHDKQRRY